MKYLALGERIRVLREKKRLSLEDVAKKTGIPRAQLENIERNIEQPIIANLIALSKILGVNVADIFRDRPHHKPFEIVKQDERTKVRPLLQPTKARILDYTYELLSIPSTDKHMDAFLIEVPPHQNKRPHEDLTHEGEEFMYILEGVLEGEIGEQKIKLHPGDTLYFRSTEPHVFFNPHEHPVRAIAVIYPF